MRIIHCPKGGKVPEGYCRTSCLNFREGHLRITAARRNGSGELRSALARTGDFFHHHLRREKVDIAF